MFTICHHYHFHKKFLANVSPAHLVTLIRGQILFKPPSIPTLDEFRLSMSQLLTLTCLIIFFRYAEAWFIFLSYLTLDPFLVGFEYLR